MVSRNTKIIGLLAAIHRGTEGRGTYCSANRPEAIRASRVTGQL
jgi:hypothetical protein